MFKKYVYWLSKIFFYLMALSLLYVLVFGFLRDLSTELLPWTLPQWGFAFARALGLVYLAFLALREARDYVGLCSFANFFWQASLSIIILFLLALKYGCSREKLGAEDAFSFFQALLPYIIWSIIGLIQLRRKIPFTPKIIVVHTAAFLVCTWWSGCGWYWFWSTFLAK